MTWQVVTYGLAIFVAAFFGGISPLLLPGAHENHLKLFVSFGAGLLLGMGFLHMLPESAALIPTSFGFWVLVGFLILLVLERFIMVHACDEHGCNYHTVGVAAFVGLAIHGIIEGFALASSLMVSEFGVFVLLAILAHKAPAGFALTSILRLSGKTNKQIALFAAGVALSGPLGLVLAYNLLRADSLPQTAGILLSLSTGTFFYIGACDLLPELHRNDAEKFKRLATFFLGILISVACGYLLDHHHHGHGEGHHSHEAPHP